MTFTSYICQEKAATLIHLSIKGSVQPFAEPSLLWSFTVDHHANELDFLIKYNKTSAIIVLRAHIQGVRAQTRQKIDN